jgi:hypothetical protein
MQFDATAFEAGGVVDSRVCDGPVEAWSFLRAVRDEQDAAAGLEYTPTARRLHEIKMACQTFGELDGTGLVCGPAPGDTTIYTASDMSGGDLHCLYQVTAR